MLKWIIKTPPKAGSKWGFFIHPKLEQLIALSDRAQHAKSPEDQKNLLDQAHRIFEYIRIGHVWRRTSRDRLGDSEQLILSALKSHQGPVSLLDVGVSDGTTSLALFNSLKTQFAEEEISFTASDLVTHLTVWRAGIFTEYRTSQGNPILARMGRLAFRMPALGGGPLKYISKFIIWLWLKNPIRESMKAAGEIPLSNPLIRQSKQITMRELNILQEDPKLQGAFNVIRAANVLNLQYFTESEISVIVSTLYEYLEMDGHLLVCRNVVKDNNQEEAHGTLYQKKENGFIQKTSFGQGSEVNTIILNLHTGNSLEC